MFERIAQEAKEEWHASISEDFKENKKQFWKMVNELGKK